MYRGRYRMSGVVVMRKKKNLAKLLRSTGHTSSNQARPVYSEISRKPKIISSTPRELSNITFILTSSTGGIRNGAVALFYEHIYWLALQLFEGF